MTADMKKLLLFLILVGAAIGWWQNPEFVRIYAEKAARSAGMFLLNLFDEPADASVDVPDAPQAVPVPSGVYYTRDRITLTQAGSTRVVEKGAQVRKIGEGNGKYLVEDAVGRFLVDPQAITHDVQEITYLQRKNVAESNSNSREVAARNIQLQIEEVDQRLILVKRELAEAEDRERLEERGFLPRNAMKTSAAFLRNVVVRTEITRTQLRQQLDKLSGTPPHPPFPPSNP